MWSPKILRDCSGWGQHTAHSQSPQTPPHLLRKLLPLLRLRLELHKSKTSAQRNTHSRQRLHHEATGFVEATGALLGFGVGSCRDSGGDVPLEAGIVRYILVFQVLDWFFHTLIRDQWKAASQMLQIHSPTMPHCQHQAKSNSTGSRGLRRIGSLILFNLRWSSISFTCRDFRVKEGRPWQPLVQRKNVSKCNYLMKSHLPPW